MVSNLWYRPTRVFSKCFRHGNVLIGSSISIYHMLHDEVREQKVHVWRCEGQCKDRPPCAVPRVAANQQEPATSHRDMWHAEHEASCGGRLDEKPQPHNFRAGRRTLKEPRAETRQWLSSLMKLWPESRSQDCARAELRA